MTTLNDTSEHELAQEDIGYENGSESLDIPTLLHKTQCLYHISTHDNLSFRPATVGTHPSPGYLTTVCHHLTFEEDKESSLNRNTTHPRMEHHSPDENTMVSTSPLQKKKIKTKKMQKDTSPQLHWMMMSGWKNQFQRGTYAFMKIHNMIYALTLACTV